MRGAGGTELSQRQYVDGSPVTKLPLEIKEPCVLGVSCTRHQRKNNVLDRSKVTSCRPYIL